MIGQKLILLDEVDSTNNYAATLLNDGKLPHGTVILAEKQTAGRGQRGNSWSSSGVNQFACSIYAETAFLSAERYWYLNLAVALAVRGSIQAHISEKAEIKWPNDILVNDRKMAGILIETQWRSGAIVGAIIGVGANMQYEPGLPAACALNEFTDAHVSPLQLSQELARQLEARFQQLRAGLWNDLVVEYLEHLWRLGVEQEAEMTGADTPLDPLSKREVATGTIRGIDNMGNLLFETNGEVRSYDLKEIRFTY